MKKILSLSFSILLVALCVVLLSSCNKQCNCNKVTHYASQSTYQEYTEYVSPDESCSKFNGEFFTEDVYGNTISVDEIYCTDAY